MPILHKNITASADIHNPKWFSDANNGDYAWRNEQGNLETIDELLLPAALNFVDASVAPPTSNTNDIYVLSSGGSVHVDWGSVSLQDWVRYDGTSWNPITPQKSSLCYNEDTDTLLSFDGLAWAAIGGGIDNVTSAEKAALSPNTGDFVYDTDLNALQRYDGSSWVTIAAGYGIISIKDSSGVPTFYSDLQTAINATSTIDTIFIHSDIELTSAVDLPITREKLTFVMNGYRIFGDTTSGDFNLFETDQNASLTRTVNFEGGGIVETVGTCVSVTAACPWNTTGSQRISFMDLGQTTFQSENADCFRAQTDEIRGGIFKSPNSTFFNTGNYIGSKFEIYESSPNDLNKVIHCDIFMTYGSWFVNEDRIFSKNVIKGTTSKSGNNGLIYGNAGSYISNNYIELESGATKDALYIRDSGTDNHGIKNNVAINLGSGSAGNFVYGSSYNNYFYSESAWGLYVGANCKNAIRNTVITNSTNRPSLQSLCDYTIDNTAISLNASHTNNPMYVGGTTNEVFNNKAICSNSSIANIKLYSTGTIYLANNTMSSVGTGLDLNGNTNAMTNTPDSYNNLQIG